MAKQSKEVSIWIIGGGSKFQLPVTELGGIGMEENYNNETVNLYKRGDILVKGNSGLREFNYSSHFPDQKYSYVDIEGELPNPYHYVRRIIKCMSWDRPLRLIITGTGINMPCRISSFNYEERDGTGSVYYDITMTESRSVNKPKLSTVGTYGTSERRPRTADDNKLASGMAK